MCPNAGLSRQTIVSFRRQSFSIVACEMSSSAAEPPHPPRASCARHPLPRGERETPAALSSRDLPGGAVFGILDHHSHRRKFVADAIGFLEILARARSGARRDQICNLLCIDTPRLLLSASPRVGALGKESQEPQGDSELIAILFASRNRSIPHP